MHKKIIQNSIILSLLCLGNFSIKAMDRRTKKKERQTAATLLKKAAGYLPTRPIDEQKNIDMILEFGLKGIDITRVERRQHVRAMIDGYPVFRRSKYRKAIKSYLPDKKRVAGLPLTYKEFDDLSKDQQHTIDWMLHYGLNGTSNADIEIRQKARDLRADIPKLAEVIKSHLPDDEEMIEELPLTYQEFDDLSKDQQHTIDWILEFGLNGASDHAIKMRQKARDLRADIPKLKAFINSYLHAKK